jgi:acyl-CoA synthetase (AMP-forming)/AMP-acid ligase II
MRNRPEYLEALFAIWHAGLVAVPVNARLHRDEIAEYRFVDSLPTINYGKVVKRELRDQLRSEVSATNPT